MNKIKIFRFCMNSMLAIIIIYTIGHVESPLLYFIALFGAYRAWDWIIVYILSFIMYLGSLRNPVIYDIVTCEDKWFDSKVQVGKQLIKTPNHWTWKIFQFVEPTLAWRLKNESLQ